MSLYPQQSLDLTALEAEFVELQAGFIQRLPEREHKIAQMLNSLLANSGQLDTAELKLLHREVHNLVGATGSYQMNTISQSARVFERLLWQLISDAPGIISVAAQQQLQLQSEVLFKLIQSEISVSVAKR
ncbi:MAG: Hpt domain-containing protein [Marinospirillum sp.]|uniref:Hpt domain-containing protein n=1 Tax=Marinospirillum sp. TaxID=2183934 RepID=UPI001A03F8F4|nr:Hpt domain-containing protein [Marinospirillum sp.]MBE0508811.1 Hpt domain-containing protein [Marinospirillum sp.]